MNRFLRLIAALFLCSSSAKATTIVDVQSPVRIEVQSLDERSLLNIDGRVIQFCATSGFGEWAKANLLGNKVAFRGEEPYVNIGGQWFSVSEILVRNGYLYDAKFKDALFAAAAERVGEWSCARKDAVFNMVLKNKNNAKIVAALALNESQYKGYPWPWTLNANGKSMYFRTREEAHSKILELLSLGITKIDIGITQIDWKFHSHRFSSPWEALDVSANIKASEDIVVYLYRKHGDLAAAIRCYHNCVDTKRGARYLNSFATQLATLDL